MPLISIPATGLKLVDDSSKAPSPPVQVMRLDLTRDMLEEILKTAASKHQKIQIHFGRIVTLHYGSKPHQLVVTTETCPAHLYRAFPPGKAEMTLIGRLTHKLAMQQANECLAYADAAMVRLQSQMDSYKQKKLARQIQFVPNGKDLPPPRKLRAAEVRKREKSAPPKRSTDAATRSMSSSPAMTGSGLALKTADPPTSQSLVNDAKTVKLQAIRTPLIHLLAVRPVSEKFLSSTIGCTQQECLEILQKIGRPYTLDSSKWDLSDKGFKDLDIWKFPYPTLEDRHFAVDRAIKAFDRQRLGRNEPLWQMLLPRNERGQGKVLSKLQLITGFTQHVAPPRINVQPTGHAKREGASPGYGSDRNDRLGPAGAPSRAPSKSQEAVKGTKMNQKDALSKRLPKASQAVKASDPPRGTKKGTKKATANANNAHVKSAEFVHESDEEMEDVGMATAKADGMPPSSANGMQTSKLSTDGVPSIPATTKIPVGTDSKNTSELPTAAGAKKAIAKKAGANKAVAAKPVVAKPTAAKPPTTKPTTAKPTAAKPTTAKPVTAKPAATKPAAAKPAAAKPVAVKPAANRSPSFGTKKRISEASRNKAKALSRQQTSTSPFKPSPLGSSPPTNASDLENEGLGLPASSNSSTPLISQSRQVNGSTPAYLAGTMRPAPKSIADGSAMLKRKANDIDSGVHYHAGQAIMGGGDHASKRQKTSMSPPTSNPSTVSSRSTSDSPTTNHDRLVLAQSFKTDYITYERLYNEVYAWRDAPSEKIKEVLKMHERLLGMKKTITNGAKN